MKDNRNGFNNKFWKKSYQKSIYHGRSKGIGVRDKEKAIGNREWKETKNDDGLKKNKLGK